MLIVRWIIGLLLIGRLVGHVGLERRERRRQIGVCGWGVRRSSWRGRGRSRGRDRIGILRKRRLRGRINGVIGGRIAGGEGWRGLQRRKGSVKDQWADSAEVLNVVNSEEIVMERRR